MRKRKIRKYPKRGKQSVHIIARIRREIGVKTSNLADIKETFGIPQNTMKKIISGALDFSPKSAEIVSRNTGVSMDSLLSNDADIIAVNDTPWNRSVYENLKIANQSTAQTELNLRYETTRLIHWQRILSLKVARALFAAYAVDQTDKAIFRIKEAVASIENTFVEEHAEKGACRHFLQEWDTNTQREIGRIKPGKRGFSKKSAVIGRSVHDALQFLYRKQERNTKS